ncbi:MAG: hypothetical protein DRP85_03760 [Candidatus Makaraimicrobium thalassicum]|nr:MAG: hypothetical protein DRP85_03760 [Candidatus Omnitrophota bacterium]
MIERMKKITVLVSENEREKFLPWLKRAGVLHIRHVKTPVHHEINFLEDRISKIERMLSILSPYAEKRGEEMRESSHERDILEMADKVETARTAKESLLTSIEELKRQIQWFEPWGGFDPEDIAELKAKGISIRFYRARKNELNKPGQDKGYYVIGEKRGYAYLVAVSRGLDEETPVFEEMTPPPAGPEKMTEELEGLNSGIAEIDGFLKEAARALEAIKKCERKLKGEREVLKVKFGMQEEGKFSYLQGFCPVKMLSKITSMAEHHGLGYLIEEPDNPDETPTVITNPRWISIIDPVFQFMNTLPGYNEFDISFYFLVFFSLFFAMLIGDAGYGLFFLLVTFLARRRLKDLPTEPFFLMYLLSVGTIVWGTVTGTWFGAEKIAQLPFFKGLVIERVNSFADNNQDFLIYICFLIGAVHLTIAHFLRGLKVINSARALAEAGWIMILWGMFFAAGKFVISKAFPSSALWLFVLGAGLVLLFSNPQKGILKGVLGTLAELPLSVISSFSDIVSYLRLFAVGYATVIVAKSFNDMALAGGVHSVIGALAATVILFLGHTLNIILGFMAVIVHGIRLNMLEFSSHLGMQWSGKKYEPFCEK